MGKTVAMLIEEHSISNVGCIRSTIWPNHRGSQEIYMQYEFYGVLATSLDNYLLTLTKYIQCKCSVRWRLRVWRTISRLSLPLEIGLWEQHWPTRVLLLCSQCWSSNCVMKSAKTYSDHFPLQFLCSVLLLEYKYTYSDINSSVDKWYTYIWDT